MIGPHCVMPRASRATIFPMFNRITQNPEVMAGKPTIRSMRVTVSMIIRQLAQGKNVEGLLKRYPYLEAEDIQQALAHSRQTP
jgi:uncharacterized protein (DUF433 family)